MSGHEARRYGPMLLDEVRVATYRAALERLIEPTTHVLDVGCGTGVFTLAALELGAAHVTAIDQNPVVDLLPTVIRANGYADRCSIYRGDVTALTDQRFELIVSDLRGTLPLYRDHLAVIDSVRAKNLAPDGVLLPKLDRLVVGLVDNPTWREQQYRPWRSGQHDLSAYSDQVMRTPQRVSELSRSSLVSSTAVWAEIDYGSATDLNRTNYAATVSLEATADTADGLAVWFETTIHDGLGFDTGPSDSRPTYGRLFLPLPDPIRCRPGADVEVSIAAHRLGDDYVWRWSVHPPDQVPMEVSSFESMALGAAAETLGTRSAASLERLDRERLALDANLLALLASGADPGAVEAELVEVLTAERPTDGRQEIQRSARRHLAALAERYRQSEPVRLL